MTEKHLALRNEELVALTEGLGNLFARPEPREVFADLMDGLLAGLGRVNGWTLAARAGHATPHRVQKFLNAASWSADALRDRVREYVLAELGDPGATLVLDDIQVQKKGTRSAGVARQYCYLTKDVRNCQVMVMLTYATAGGHAFIDRALYLPESWADDRGRCRAAGVPDEVAFATRPQLGLRMLERALAARAPFSWVAADSDYGRDPQLRAWLHERALRYVLAVPVDLPLSGPPGTARRPKAERAADLLHYGISRDRWARHSCGEGSKGQQFYDWSAFEAEVPGQAPAAGFAHWLLVRRSTEKKQLTGGPFDYEYAFFLVHAPVVTPVPEMISRAGVTWQVEEDNREGEHLVGLGGYQVRTWTAWHRNVTCAMLALAFLVVQRARHSRPEPLQADAGRAEGTAPAAACAERTG
ncbi:IS701 family transposase [Streptomyces sp. NPDC020362]|uniref:IS701 family transposase n=1 Tax=unclassified Streptomyces TaxID=2593676 RepID=UPI0033FDD86C